MRIISKYKDYYDYVQSFGFDPHMVYVRNTEWKPIDKQKYKLRDIRVISGYNQSNKIDLLIIGFCGEIYKCAKFADKHYYSIEELTEALKVSEFPDYYFKRIPFSSLPNNTCNRSYGDLKYFFSEEFNKGEWQDIFKDFNTPIWSFNFESGYLHINVSDLQDYNFYDVFDPNQAYQELQMYLGCNREMIGTSKTKYDGKPLDDTVSDKDLAVAKGFDKYSFRKDKKK